ncbi:hypothetical protein L596_016571 [Steinernema carpocapsae]|uniref:Uncharacterized protein n=1 Tax=Steinernema carpocapsae TaxID=34508 RepID=A0A4U5NJB2_STECR|nr:hypothetical protein L596_016571 [Steinernema carpocapsae]
MPHNPFRGGRSRTPVQRGGNRSLTPVGPIEESTKTRARGRPQGNPAPRRRSPVLQGPVTRAMARRGPVASTIPAPHQRMPSPEAANGRTPQKTPRAKRHLAETSLDEEETPVPRTKAKIANGAIRKKLERVLKNVEKQAEANAKTIGGVLALLED